MIRNQVALWLDSILFITAMLVVAVGFTGLPLHECLGLVIVVPILYHLLLQWSWVVNEGRRFFRRGSLRRHVNFLLNLCLFITIVAAIVSGIMASRTILPALGIARTTDPRWHFVHGNSAGLARLFVAFHIALNWDWIVAAFRRLFRGSSQPANGGSR